ncbi:LAETG motif-containing sortase-dependent surface protein [Streptomyces sp. NPDC026665]|uniref:LAETG motif-containing sortase-dependent surface protein n=1 Tax=Streptomyces sp. NPDC026665 TaxID=3154798 RepID=UPI0033FC8DD2
MSTASSAVLRFLIGTGAAALAVSAVGATNTYAADQQARGARGDTYQPSSNAARGATSPCQFTLDGNTWISAAETRTSRLTPDSDGKVHIGVRAGSADPCTASLASYGAQGPTWQTSGKQVFVDFDTATLAHGATDTLDITVPGPECFAQIDLYRGDTKHDGKTGDLPEGPHHPVFKDDLIAAWHGGTKTCATSQSPAPAEPSATPTPTESSITPTPTESSITPTPTEPSATPTPRPATTAPGLAESSSSAAAVPSPSKRPSSSLAETGSSNTVALAAGAVFLLAGGAGVVVVARRRQASHQR